MFFLQTVQNDTHEKRPIKHFSWRHRYGFSSVMILITGHFRFVAVTLASVHRQGLFRIGAQDDAVERGKMQKQVRQLERPRVADENKVDRLDRDDPPEILLQRVRSHRRWVGELLGDHQDLDIEEQTQGEAPLAVERKTQHCGATIKGHTDTSPDIGIKRLES
jgi:hypothetical protein